MTNSRIYYSQEAESRAKEEARKEMTSLIAVFFGFGVITGAALALVFSATRKKPKTFADRLEDQFEIGQRATSEARQRLEREFEDFRKRLERITSQ